MWPLTIGKVLIEDLKKHLHVYQIGKIKKLFVFLIFTTQYMLIW